jgi:outer membrane protein assembly factor BamB
MLRRCVVALAVALLWTSVISAAEKAEWPQFRGPKRDDVSPDKGLLKEWPKNGPKVVWKATGVGGGFSSVAIAGGKLYTLGNGKRGQSFVHAIDLDSGKLLWSTKLGPQGGNLGCTPTIDGERLYAVGQEGDFACLDSATGEVKWTKHFKKDFHGDCGGWHYTESPLVDGDQVVVTPGAKEALMVALDKRTGEVIWRCPSPFGQATAGYSSIVIAEPEGIRHYVQLTAGGIVGVEAKSGKLLWSSERFAGNTANIPTPIVLKGQVFCSAGYNTGAVLLNLIAENGDVSIKEQYFKPELTNKHGGVVLVGDYVYGDHDDSGSPFCADVKTGKVVWRKSDRGAGRGSAAVTYADGHLYFRYDNGIMTLVDASPTEYKEVGWFKIPNAGGQSWSHPVVVGGRMYLREQDTVWCYDVKEP